MSNLRDSLSLPAASAATWLAVLRRYITLIVLANLLWEIAHLPLYAMWQKGSAGEMAFAVIHCTGGDVLIASIALLGALLLLGNARWPAKRYLAVAALAFVVGLGYTIFSEWLNTTIRRSWAYSDLMPTLPAIEVGLSPLAQWIVIPLVAFWLARRPRRGHDATYRAAVMKAPTNRSVWNSSASKAGLGSEQVRGSLQ